MSTTHTTPLAAKVAAVNEVHAEIMRLTPLLAAIFTPLLGKKLLKVTGGFFDKYKDLLPASTLELVRYNQSVTLCFQVTSRINHKAPSSYREGDFNYASYSAIFNIGEFDRDHTTLKSMYPSYNWRTDYNEADIIAIRNEIEDAESALRNAKGKLYPFDLYDR